MDTDMDVDFLELMPIKQKSGKTIYTFAVEGDLDVAKIKSNTFEIEWPPRSGKKELFPEVDKAEWFTLSEAKQKIIPGQVGFLDELIKKLKK